MFRLSDDFMVLMADTLEHGARLCRAMVGTVDEARLKRVFCGLRILYERRIHYGEVN